MSQYNPAHLPKTRKLKSLQEEVVHGFSTRILGTQALFIPDIYGNSEEPSDVAWVANRCAILMYMTAGNQSFEKKRKHNYSQLHRWLKQWRSGQPLAGISGRTQHSFDFQDVDHIIALSVVGGRDSGCQYDADQIIYSKHLKLSACATITDNVIRALYNGAANPRDLLFWLSYMQDASTRLEEGAIVESIQKKMEDDFIEMQNKFMPWLKKTQFFDHALNESAFFVSALKNKFNLNADSSDITPIGTDLRCTDVLWMAFSYAALESQIALPGETGPLVMFAAHDSGIYRLQCLTCATNALLVEHLKTSLNMRSGISILTCLDIGVEAPIRMIAVTPRVGLSMLEVETAELRGKTLGSIVRTV